jgi:L-ascorbate metabolism protein UlaG (beta-lactamase superfamily)
MKRRKLLGRLALGGLGLAAVPSAYFYHQTERYVPVRSQFTRNPDLKDLLPAGQWPGTPLDQKGLFMNEQYPFWPKFAGLVKWQTEKNPYRDQKKADPERLPVVQQPSLAALGNNALLWLGHASFLLRINGVTLLIDPVLASPSVLMERFSALPLPTAQLMGIDYILVSHDHRDHCDKDSVTLLARQNPGATWLCGLHLDGLLRDWTGSANIQAAGWYQQYHTDGTGVKVYYLPSRHWSRRGLADTNRTLWGAFVIEGGGRRVYFGGDSGYGAHVGRVRELFGTVDYYLAGIGAFAPRWFMGPSHMHPEEAVKAAHDLQPKNLLPMHYGTFDLSDEPLLEPARIIRQLHAQGTLESRLVLPAVGEVVSL